MFYALNLQLKSPQIWGLWNNLPPDMCIPSVPKGLRGVLKSQLLYLLS